MAAANLPLSDAASELVLEDFPLASTGRHAANWMRRALQNGHLRGWDLVLQSDPWPHVNYVYYGQLLLACCDDIDHSDHTK